MTNFGGGVWTLILAWLCHIAPPHLWPAALRKPLMVPALPLLVIIGILYVIGWSLRNVPIEAWREVRRVWQGRA